MPPETSTTYERWLTEATRGRLWWVRAPLVPVMAWIAWRHAGDIWYSSLLSGLNLVFHEMGHVLFGMLTFGHEFWSIAGGTILELAVPLLAAIHLGSKRDAFGVSFCVFWLGTAFAHVGTYIYDTRSQILGRVSIGPSAGPDDWTYLLGRWDLIRQDRAIGMGVKEFGVWVMAAGVLWGLYVLWKMARVDGRGSSARAHEV